MTIGLAFFIGGVSSDGGAAPGRPAHYQLFDLLTCRCDVRLFARAWRQLSSRNVEVNFDKTPGWIQVG